MSKGGQLCRICLRKCKNRYISLKDICIGPHELDEEDKQQSITYLTAYNVCTQLKALPGADGLPDCLCTSCSKNLQAAYQLWRKARETDVRVRCQLLSVAKGDQLQELNIHEAAPYLEAGFELANALNCSGAAHAKDPLEETDAEVEFKVEEPWSVNANTATSTNARDDSDDDKPLKDLLLSSKEKFNALEKRKPSQENLEFELSKASNNGNIEHLLEDEVFEEDGNCLDGNAGDLMSATEAQIFPKGRFKCKICEKTYFTVIGLKAHLDVHLPKSVTVKKKRLRCANKSRRKSQPIEATEQRTALSLPQADDSTCGEQASGINEKANVEAENETTGDKSISKTRKVKLPKPKKMFPCHVCGKHMISASKLRYHMVMHTGEKDYLCTMCPKAYSTIYALKHHIRTHTGERPYECKFCGDKFLRPTTLKSHQRRHTGERPYGCDICGKRFIQHSSMTTHMKLNHMDKTIQCPHCDKKYARQTDLNTHLLSHTGDKPYSCQLCPSRFIRQANLNKHMNQHHAGKPGTSSESKGTKSGTKRANTKRATEKEQRVGVIADAVRGASCCAQSTVDESHTNVEMEMELQNESTAGNGDGPQTQIAMLQEPLLHSDLGTAQYICSEQNSCDLLLNVQNAKGLQTSLQPNTAQNMQHDLVHWNWSSNT